MPVVGLAHGSRHDRGRDAIEALMDAVASRGGVPARPAYLDLAQPDLETVCTELASLGHRRAVVVPLLFTQAFHASVDVPGAVAAASASTGVDLTVAPILGTGDDVADVLRSALAEAGVDGSTQALLFAVGSSRPEANGAVADLAERLGRGRPGQVRHAFGTCAPRTADVLTEMGVSDETGLAAGVGEPVALWPLFLADGLLLDPLRRLATEQGWRLVEPLGARAAGLVLDRYHAALRLEDAETVRSLG